MRWPSSPRYRAPGGFAPRASSAAPGEAGCGRCSAHDIPRSASGKRPLQRKPPKRDSPTRPAEIEMRRASRDAPYHSARIRVESEARPCNLRLSISKEVSKIRLLGEIHFGQDA